MEKINKEYHNRISFIGHVKNKEVNDYLNRASLAIFPSLFDNYPYVILEAMATGKTIVASDNIGSYDIIKDNNYIFKNGNSIELANCILSFYEIHSRNPNYKNIEIVKNECNPNKICEKMKLLYKKTIEEYYENR
ncbi:MAG: glycosyltransferase family 4 protein [Bacilli bacterium]